MKFGKGNLVEVFRREHDPCGSWFTGSILSADGENYVVRYKLLMDREGKPVVEKVQGKDVRPLPPSVNGKNWAIGDVAEVFDIRCWRVGKVAKVLKNSNRFVIKFFGSIQLKEFHASSLRIRQAWHGNKWLVIGKVAQGKDSANNFETKIPYRASGLPFRTSLHMLKTRHYEECNIDRLFGGTLNKRKSPVSSRGCDRTRKRTLPLFNQIDDISCPRVGVPQKFIKQSTNRNSRMEDTTLHSLYDSSRPAWRIEDSDQSSVASCSFNGVARYGGQVSHKSLKNTPDNSDAESSFPLLCGERDSPPCPVDKVVDIHELELCAYKSTMEALYVSGPLTWEQESLLTNLRLSLNISDDEHLLQLRHLLSAHIQ